MFRYLAAPSNSPRWLVWLLTAAVTMRLINLTAQYFS